MMLVMTMLVKEKAFHIYKALFKLASFASYNDFVRLKSYTHFTGGEKRGLETHCLA